MTLKHKVSVQKMYCGDAINTFHPVSIAFHGVKSTTVLPMKLHDAAYAFAAVTQRISAIPPASIPRHAGIQTRFQYGCLLTSCEVFSNFLRPTDMLSSA